MKEYIEKNIADRKKLQKQLRDMNEKRSLYITEQRKKDGKAAEGSFSQKVFDSVVEQAGKNAGLKFEDKKVEY